MERHGATAGPPSARVRGQTRAGRFHRHAGGEEGRPHQSRLVQLDPPPEHDEELRRTADKSWSCSWRHTGEAGRCKAMPWSCGGDETGSAAEMPLLCRRRACKCAAVKAPVPFGCAGGGAHHDADDPDDEHEVQVGGNLRICEVQRSAVNRRDSTVACRLVQPFRCSAHCLDRHNAFGAAHPDACHRQPRWQACARGVPVGRDRE